MHSGQVVSLVYTMKILTKADASVELQEMVICQVVVFVYKCHTWYFYQQDITEIKQIVCFIIHLKKLRISHELQIFHQIY